MSCWVAGVCESCGLGYEVDPAAGPGACVGCGGSVEVFDVEARADVDAGDELAAELAVIEYREQLLGDVLAAFDVAGLSGLADAVEVLDGDTARDCLFLAVVQLSEGDALAGLAGWN